MNSATSGRISRIFENFYEDFGADPTLIETGKFNDDFS
jgi:hypothetical protein